MHLTAYGIQVFLDRWRALGTHTLYRGEQGSGLFFQGDVFLGDTVSYFAVIVNHEEPKQEQRRGRIDSCQQAKPDTAWTLHQSIFPWANGSRSGGTDSPVSSLLKCRLTAEETRSHSSRHIPVTPATVRVAGGLHHTARVETLMARPA